ncbi:MAG: glycosyl hydrolase family 18 protein [Bacillota bacterium]|nr:glycosyl hydrolase family 18 protein [Bacillota bacterium]
MQRSLLGLALAAAVLTVGAIGAFAGTREANIIETVKAFLLGSRTPAPGNGGDGPPSFQPAPPVKRTIAVMGFYTDPEPGLPGSLPAALREAGSLTYVCPFWYQIGFDGDGSVIAYGPGYDPVAARSAVRQLQARGVKVLALLHNMRLGQAHDTRTIFHDILGSPELRGALTANIQRLIREMGFDGLNLDTEFVRPADRDLYTLFVSELAAALRSEGYLITADLPAKTADDPDHSWAGGFDIAALAPHLDAVVIMAYDEHSYVTKSGPVASIGWVEAVVRYTVSVVPPEKVLLGLAGHAFDWLVGAKYPKYTSYARVMDTAARTGAPVLWDDKSQTPFLRYTDRSTGDKREAWFDNEVSFALKLELADRYGLGGVALWRLGLEDPALWPLIRSRYEVTRQP